jgi:ATP-dependent Lon protease
LSGLFVGREKSIVALNKAMDAGKRILLVAQEAADLDDPQPADLYEVGTLATILQLSMSTITSRQKSPCSAKKIVTMNAK